jgi:very-short-patch-repair endonuclease
VLDFFCAEHCIAVEIDGEAHGRGSAPAHDAERDSWLRSQGVRVIRIPAAAVLADLEAVVRHIVSIARGEYPSTAFRGPPSPSGGGSLASTPIQTGTRSPPNP